MVQKLPPSPTEATMHKNAVSGNDASWRYGTMFIKPIRRPNGIANGTPTIVNPIQNSTPTIKAINDCPRNNGSYSS